LISGNGLLRKSRPFPFTSNAQRSDIRTGRGIEQQDWDFHIAMVAAAKNDIFVRVVNTFYFLSWARRQVYFSDIKRSRHSNAQHKKIFRAIEAQDAPAAIALMQQHLGQVERD
jgi:DNA-binding GntR family transcriptional regulator